MGQVQGWGHRLLLTTAGGFYRAMLRRMPNADCWAWAVEWNSHYRLIGFLGNEDAAIKGAADLPRLTAALFGTTHGGHVRGRAEESLREADDILFGDWCD